MKKRRIQAISLEKSARKAISSAKKRTALKKGLIEALNNCKKSLTSAKVKIKAFSKSYGKSIEKAIAAYEAYDSSDPNLDLRLNINRELLAEDLEKELLDLVEQHIDEKLDTDLADVNE